MQQQQKSKQEFISVINRETFAKELNSDLAKHYSLMKHGYKKSIDVLAMKLASGIDKYDTIIGSPYMNIPNPSSVLAATVAAIVGCRYIRTHRVIKHNKPYCQYNKEDRFKLIKDDELFINSKLLQYANNRIIFIDDCLVTGTHQLMIEEKIIAKNVVLSNAMTKRKVLFKYVYKIDSSVNLNTEDRLNHLQVTNPIVLLENITKSNTVVLNSRNIKFILQANTIDLVNYLENNHINSNKLKAIIEFSKTNNYQEYPKLIHNLKILSQWKQL